MKINNYKILIVVILLLITASVYSQTYLISQPGTITTCAGTIYDSGGATGNYGSNENFTKTICSDLPGARLTLLFTAFNLESATWDNLNIYDGPSAASPALITNAGNAALLNVTVQATGECLTLVWHTDGSGQYAGFAANISCLFPCQDFTIAMISTNPPVTNTDSLFIDICEGETVTFNAQGTYPNSGVNYIQSDALTTWNWRIIHDNAIIPQTGTNLTSITRTFSSPGGHSIYLEAVDQNGCSATLTRPYRVRVSIPPLFTGTNALEDTVCIGDEVHLTGIVVPVPWEEEFTDEVAGVTFLPDGSGVSYTTSITNGTFESGATITSVNDIISICLNMEHTYMGDLSMRLECPNGQLMTIFAQGGGGTILGEPVGTSLPVDSNSTDITPGIGYDYCWSPTSTSGPISSAANWQTVAPYVDPIGNVSTSVSQLLPGTYQITGNWTDLIGCPLNGSWTIHITDHMSADNGYIFSWQLNFAAYLIPSYLWSIENTYDPDDMLWTGNGINPNSGGTATANPTISGLQPYTFTVIDDFGCSHDTTVNVFVRNANDSVCCNYPNTTAGPDAHVCTNTYTFNATMAAGNTGNWALLNGPGTIAWVNQNSPHAIVTVNGWGIYEFQWTEQCGAATCIDRDTVIIEFRPVPTTTFTYDAIMCNADTTTLIYTGNMTSAAVFNWNFDGASVISGSGIGPYQLYWSTSGMHSVGLTISANGCTSLDTLVNINNPQLLEHTLVVDDDPCFQGCRGRAEITLTGGTLPYNYSWASPTNILPNLCANNYSIIVEDANGCTVGENFVVNEPPQLVINNITTTDLLCYQSDDGTISVNASGGTGDLLYLWSDIGYGLADRTDLIAGDYCVTVEDEHGCTVRQCIELIQPNELLVTMSPNIAICEGQQTVIQASGMGGTVPYTYLWDQGSGFTTASSSLTLTPNTTTNYSVYVRDAHNCISNTATMRVTVSPKMIIDTMLLRHNRCYQSCDGAAEIVMHGGILPLQYSWGSQNHIYNGLCAGIYTVTVNDIIGCSVSEMFVIEQPTQMTYTTANDAATCFGYDDGEATIYVQGGVPPYSYTWPNGHNTETLVTHAGNYTVTVLDDHNCRITSFFSITQPSDLIVLPIGNRTICQSQSVILNTQVTGGTPYYDFRWTGNDGSIWNSNLYEVTPSSTTTYSLVVTDSHGCQSDPISSIVYVNPELQILSVLTSNDTVCPGDPAIIHVDVIGGNGGPYLMTLQNGRVVPSPFTVRPDTTTMYYITLEDMCGTPSVTDSILIIARPKPGNLFVAEDVDGCPPFAAYFTESTPNYGQTYLWNFGDKGYSTEKNPVHIYTDPGRYSVSLEVRDFFGCKHLRKIEDMITIYQGPTALFEATPEVVSFLAPEVEFINYSSNATDYYWFFGDGDSSLFVSPRHQYPTIGEYEVMLVAESSNDCTDTTTRIITVRNEFAFYFPTSFTPNGDGINDCARPCGNGIDKSNFSLVIYDRWGNLVFETDKFDPDVSCDACTAGSWDGTDNGNRIKGDKILSNGMYHWYAEFKDWNGVVYKEQGVITLTR